jgi:hypothetical protein
MDFPRLLSVEPRPDYRIYLRYDDGTEGVYNVKPLIEPDTVFAHLRDEVLFRQVDMTSHGRGIEWPSEVDLCTRSLYLNLTGQSYEQWQAKQVVNA